MSIRPIIPSLRDEDSMTLGKLGSEWIAYLLGVRGYSPDTTRGYDTTLAQFRAYLRGEGRQDIPREFTDDAVLGFVTDLGQRGVKPNTLVIKLSALSAFAQYAMKRKDHHQKPYLDRNPTKGFEWPQMQATETQFLHPEELRAFIDVPLPEREAIARDLLFDTGLRASELCRTNVGDVVELGGRWVVSVTVKGRGTRQRRLHIPLSAPVVEGVREYLLARGMPKSAEPLLVTARGTRLTRANLYYVIVKTARAAGIDRFRVSPHKVRHTINLVRKLGGVDRYARSRLLGQSDPRSQDRYEHLAPGELHDAKTMQADGLARYLARSPGITTGEQ